jgi:hypothetical protein
MPTRFKFPSWRRRRRKKIFFSFFTKGKNVFFTWGFWWGVT